MITKMNRVGLTVTCLLLILPAARAAGDYESPPLLKAAEFAPKDLPLKGPHYAVDGDVETDGLLATYTIRSDFGKVEARGAGMLRTRLAEVGAVAELDTMAASDVFVDAMKRSASSLGNAVSNVISNPKEVAKAAPASVGRFLERTARSVKTAGQKLGDIAENRDAGAPRGTEAGTNQQNVAVAGTVAAGRATLDILGYDEQRRQLARKLGVDPYTTNPVLKKKLDDTAKAAFAGGLGIDVLTAKVPGGRLVKSTSTLTDWIYEKSPGDLRVWMEKSLRETGVDQDTIDLFLRQKYWTLTTQTALVLALEQLKDVEGLVEVLETAVAAEDEDQARFLATGMALLAHEHKARGFKVILNGKPIGIARDGAVVATLPLDYVCWTARVEEFIHRKDLASARSIILITGRFSSRARDEIKKAGWEVVEDVALSNAL